MFHFFDCVTGPSSRIGRRRPSACVAARFLRERASSFQQVSSWKRCAAQHRKLRSEHFSARVPFISLHCNQHSECEVDSAEGDGQSFCIFQDVAACCSSIAASTAVDAASVQVSLPAADPPSNHPAASSAGCAFVPPFLFPLPLKTFTGIIFGGCVSCGICSGASSAAGSDYGFAISIALAAPQVCCICN